MVLCSSTCDILQRFWQEIHKCLSGRVLAQLICRRDCDGFVRSSPRTGSINSFFAHLTISGTRCQEFLPEPTSSRLTRCTRFAICRRNEFLVTATCRRTDLSGAPRTAPPLDALRQASSVAPLMIRNECSQFLGSSSRRRGTFFFCVSFFMPHICPPPLFF
jgi:hypothetical protein